MRSLIPVWFALALIGVMPCVAAGNTVAAGQMHTVVATPNGSVWTWGRNSSGQLGNGTTTDSRTPTVVPAISNVVAVAAGSIHTLVLKSDGTVWSWGDNGWGQLGDGTTTRRLEPVLVLGLTSVVAIAAGEGHSVALTADGRVWTWGTNTLGELGDGTTTRETMPVLVPALTGVTAIGAGDHHTLAVKADGTVWAWGYNNSKQLGDGTTTQRNSPVQMTGVTGASAVAGGSGHSLILRSDGTLLAVGLNTSGQLGDGTNTTRSTAVPVPGLTGVSAIAAGHITSYARTSAGAVWAWGAGGRLGDGTSTPRYSPVQVSAVTDASLLAAGDASALAVTAPGVVWVWGENNYGQLGDGTTQNRLSPVAISDPNYGWKVATPVFSVAAGTYNTEKTVIVTCGTSDAVIHYTVNGDDPAETDQVVTSGGSILIDQTRTLKARAWKTGTGASNIAASTYTLAVAALVFSPSPGTYTTPQTVTISTTSAGVTIRYTTDGSTPTESSAAYTAPLAVATSITIKAVGFRAGWTPTSLGSASYAMNFGTLQPPVISPGAGSYTTQVEVSLTAATGATIRYTTDGTAVTTSSPIYAGPVCVTTTTTINTKAYHPDYTTSTQATAAYTIVVATPALSPTTGTYPSGQVITASSPTPGAVLRYTLNGATPTASDAVLPPGGVMAGNFTLKVGAWKTGCTPSAIATASYAVTGSLTTAKVAAGLAHSVAIRPDGVFWSWGGNPNGQLGDGTTTTRTLPVMVSVAGAVALAAGHSHSLAVTTDGRVYAWGSNVSGRLGDGTTTQRAVPTLIQGLPSIVAVHGGWEHSLALSADGHVWSWGANSSGQLGDGSSTQRLSPVQALGLPSITGISARGLFSLAVAGDGTVWSWGANGNGQLGTGDTASRSTPGQVAGLTTVTRVAAGSAHALALLSDRTVRGWGFNGAGQIGDGTTTQRNQPTTVAGLSDITAIAAGDAHSLALDATGVVWAWGNNTNGQLGDGTTIGRLAPVQVQGLPAIVAIAAGYSHSLAVAQDASVWTWGYNADGELGDGTNTRRLLPVMVAGAGMSWTVAAPVLSVPAGTYTMDQAVIVTCSDAGAVLHFTTNGADPTESDPTVASGSAVQVTQSLTLKVRAWKPGAVVSQVTSAAYELKAVTPSISPAPGAYASSQSVTITGATTGAVLRYTTDGTEPSDTSPGYTGPLNITDMRTVKARAFKPGWTPSDSAAASYMIYAATVATPTMAPAAGTYTTPQIVTLGTTTSGATIRYTVDGTDPDVTSTPYEYPFLVDDTVTVKARAFMAGLNASAVASNGYSLDVAGRTVTPTITPAGGRFASARTVTITGPPGATLRYTTSGADPTEADPAVPTSGTLVVDRAETLKVRAWAPALSPSAVRRAQFLITGAIAAGNAHTLGLAADGHLWAWGRCTEGQCGDGDLTTTHLPPVSPALTGVVAVAAGRFDSFAVTTNGALYAFGYNISGQLGNGTTNNAYSPFAVPGLPSVVGVAAGDDHTLAVTADGRVWSWGDNAHGQLGDGTTTARTSPGQVPGLSGITAVAAGDGFSLALQSDGAAGGFIWAWGANASGQLGDGSTLARTMPVRVVSITAAVQIAAGKAFALARLADGRLVAWGANDRAQLGTMLGGISATPVVVPGLNDLVSVAAGAEFGLAVDVGGQAWAWGWNDAGQLGTLFYNPPIATGAPQIVAGLGQILATGGGAAFSTWLRADGGVWACGTGPATGLGSEHYYAAAAVPGFSLAANSSLLSDSDGDGLANWQEYARALDPFCADTNHDGVTDAAHVLQHSNGANPDDDADGVPNAVETAQGTNPFVVDSDGDGVSDLLDGYPLDPTRSTRPPGDPGDTTPPTITLIAPASARRVGGGGL